MRLSCCFVALANLLCSVLFTLPAQAQFEEMINRVPRDANAMVLVNGDKVFSSPVAKRENWQANRQKMFEAGLAFLPPNAESGLLASHLDFEFMLPTWEVALFHSHQAVTAEAIQKRIGGKLDKILNQPAVDAPGDAYVVVLGPQLVSLFTPQNRQVVTRWVRDYLNAKTATVSPYLQEAYAFAQDRGTPVILAIDLEGTVSPETVKKAAETVGGISAKDFDARFASTLELVKADVAQGSQLKISGTPTFFVNGMKLPGFRREFFDAVLAWELRRVESGKK